MISVVIPTYNPTKQIYCVIEDIVLQMQSLNKSFEIIVIDDCSEKKDFFKKIENIEHVRLVKKLVNCGQQMATYHGIGYSSGSIVLTVDDDRQQDLTLIPKMIEEIEKGTDIVFATNKKRTVGLSSIGSFFVSAFINRKFPMKTSYRVSSFRCFKRSLYCPNKGECDFLYLSCELLKKANSVAHYCYKAYKKQGSRYSFYKKSKLFINLIRYYR